MFSFYRRKLGNSLLDGACPVAQCVYGSCVAHELYISPRYGQPVCPLPRKVIARGAFKEKTLELHPPRLYAHILCQSHGNLTPNPPVGVIVSEMDKLSDVREALFRAVFPDAKNAEYKVWKLPGAPAETRYITLEDFNEKMATAELENSDQTFEEYFVERLDSFAVEIRSEGQWIVPERWPEGSDLSQQTQPTEDAPKPLFQTGSDFFSVLQKKPGPVTRISGPAPPPPSRDPRPAPKVCNILPGTLGLGNMYVVS